MLKIREFLANYPNIFIRKKIYRWNFKDVNLDEKWLTFNYDEFSIKDITLFGKKLSLNYLLGMEKCSKKNTEMKFCSEDELRLPIKS